MSGGREDYQMQSPKETYKSAKTKVKMVVTSSKIVVFERIYVKLSDKDGDNRLYMLA